MLKTYDQQIEEVDKEDKEETSATDEDGDDDPARHIGGNLAEGKGRIAINVSNPQDDEGTQNYEFCLIISKMDLEALQKEEKKDKEKDKGKDKEKEKKQKEKEKEKKKIQKKSKSSDDDEDGEEAENDDKSVFDGREDHDGEIDPELLLSGHLPIIVKEGEDITVRLAAIKLFLNYTFRHCPSSSSSSSNPINLFDVITDEDLLEMLLASASFEVANGENLFDDDSEKIPIMEALKPKKKKKQRRSPKKRKITRSSSRGASEMAVTTEED